MQWALLAVVVIGLFMISGRYPKIAFSILGAMVLAAVVYLLISTDRIGGDNLAITPAQLTIENPVVTPTYANGYNIAGRLVNNHPTEVLKESTLSIVMLDCKQDAPDDCLIVGQIIERLVLVVPAGQARDFTTTVHFGSPTISGNIDWRFEITQTRS